VDIRTLATVGRFKDIVFTLLKYGFDDLVERLELPGIGLVKKIHKPEHNLGTYERIRFAMEDLGPTFVKLGQMMSLRPDLLPAGLIRELTKLQDDVSALDYSEIQEVLETELKGPVDKVFSKLETRAVAAASLSQVHRGVLKTDGRVVSVKVRRPGIRRTIEKDLDILEAVAVRVHERSEDLRSYDLPNLVRETRRLFLREIDFTREAANIKIARAHRRNEDAYIPEVFEELSTERMLVMEFIEGKKLRDLDTETLEDPRSLAVQGLKSAIKQILEDGFFHADPHPGNLLLSDDKGLCLLDWGMVGRLTRDDRYDLFLFITSVVEQDSGRLTDALISMAAAEGDVDRRTLERGLLEILDYYGSLPIKDLNIGSLLLDISTLIRKHRLRLPPDLVIMIRALVTAEGTARLIYPDLNVVAEAESTVKGLAAKQFRPAIVLKKLRSSFSQLLAMQRQIPRRIARIANKIERGDLAIRFEHENLGGLIRTLENASSRLTLGIILAALIIGSSMLITTTVGPSMFGVPAIGVVGYLISAVIGLWLAFNIIRSRRF
jgi:ubiquinone biosynthesis protein